MPNKKWTREETIVAFNLYCKIPFNMASSHHPDIIAIASFLGRSPSSITMKIGNFGSFDPELKARGIVGLCNASKLDREVWEEFHQDWENLVYQSEQIIAQRLPATTTSHDEDNVILPQGLDKITDVKTRVNQTFFRSAVLSAYNNTCCITGLCIPELLIASHIKPWRVSDATTERTNPQNGLCLNALHDSAFDKGLISLDENCCIMVADSIVKHYSNEAVQRSFKPYVGKPITLPERFAPDKRFIEYHRNMIFQNHK